DEKPANPLPAEVVEGVRTFINNTALPEGSFRPGIDAAYKGYSDTGYSDLAAVTYPVCLARTFGWKLPHEVRTRELLRSRQQEDGAFVNVGGSADPKSSQARLYNTTQALVGLHALGAKPKRDPLPVLAAILKEDYKKFPLYTTSFFPLAYQAAGEPFPAEEDRKTRALMTQAEDGYVRNHIANTFHLVHYYRLMNERIPRAEPILKRVLRDQKADGSWLLNPPSWDVHAGFDAVFVVRQVRNNQAEYHRRLQRARAW